MLIAEKLAPNGATTGQAFNDKLTALVRDRRLTRIIETGTYYGTGTTMAVLKGLPPEGEFFSIECNPEHYWKATKNLEKYPVKLLLGLSVSHQDKPVNITYDGPDHIVVDHMPEHRDELYRKEISFNVPDNMLDLALGSFNYAPDLVILDSAGVMGTIEFKYLMERVSVPFLLALDDTWHQKHYKTLEFIREHPEKFDILWEIMPAHIDTGGEKFGSAIIQVK